MLFFYPHYYDSGRPRISVKSLWQTADNPKKPVCTFLPGSSVGEQTGGEKLADLLSLWQPVVKLFSPGSIPDTTKIGRGYTGNEIKS
jgi:hypothetical protein